MLGVGDAARRWRESPVENVVANRQHHVAARGTGADAELKRAVPYPAQVQGLGAVVHPPVAFMPSGRPSSKGDQTAVAVGGTPVTCPFEHADGAGDVERVGVVGVDVDGNAGNRCVRIRIGRPPAGPLIAHK